MQETGFKSQKILYQRFSQGVNKNSWKLPGFTGRIYRKTLKAVSGQVRQGREKTAAALEKKKQGQRSRPERRGAAPE
jgi:hypothetical protein